MRKRTEHCRIVTKTLKLFKLLKFQLQSNLYYKFDSGSVAAVFATLVVDYKGTPKCKPIYLFVNQCTRAIRFQGPQSKRFSTFLRPHKYK